MRKPYVYLWGIFVVAILSIGFFMEKEAYFSIKNTTSGIHLETYVRNITWDTDYRTDTPYNAGEKIEKAYVIRNESHETKKISLKRAALASQIDNANIIIDESTGSTDSIEIAPGGATIISVQGTAKSASIPLSDTENAGAGEISPKDVVDIAPVPEQKIPAPISSGGSASTSDLARSVKPEIAHLSENNFYTNVDNALEIDMTNTSDVESVLIGEKTFTPIKAETGRLFINIEKNSLPPGKYFVAAVLKWGELITAKSDIIFSEPEKKIFISNITPARIHNDIARFIVIQGENLSDVVSVQLSNNIILTRTDFVAINDQVMWVKIPEKLDPGVYHLSIMDLKNIYEIKEKTFTIY